MQVNAMNKAQKIESAPDESEALAKFIVISDTHLSLSYEPYAERVQNMFNALNVPEDEQIEHRMLSDAIERAQKKVEGKNFGIRKNVLEYDQVMNEQREIIYGERRRVLNGENMRDVIIKFINDVAESIVDISIPEDKSADEWDLTEYNQLVQPIFPMPLLALTEDQKKHFRKDDMKQLLKEQAVRLYERKEAEFPDPEQIREIERVILLRVIDQKWMAHIDDMDQLREGIGLQAYGQRDPLVEYKMIGYEMFDEMTSAMKEDTVKLLMHIRVEQKVEREEVAKATGTNKDDTAVRQPKRRENKKIYPNDPCPCGSGKKYKNCHGRK